MRKWQYFGIGLPILIVLLSVFTGGINNAMLILIYSIICTSGIGLAVWIPLAIGVGWVAYTLAQPSVRRFDGSQPHRVVRSDRPNESIQPEQSSVLQPSSYFYRQALNHYVQGAVRSNHSYERILNDLQRLGWNEAEINQAYHTATG